MPGSTYTAMAITAYGPAEMLHPMTLPQPQPAKGQVLLKTLAAGVNPIDAKTRAGLGKVATARAGDLPWVPGYDCCGEIVALGEAVEGLTVGQRVAGMVGFPLAAGCYSEFILATSDSVVPVAPSIGNSAAAGLPLAGLTAWQALFDSGRLAAGDEVVISAAAGGVGHLAVQLAVEAGATVTALASEKNHHWLTELGAARVLDYNHSEQLAEIDQVDLWLDLIGGHAATHQMAEAGGITRVVTLPTVTAPEVIAAAEQLGAVATGMLVAPDLIALTELFSRLEKGALRLNISKEYPLIEAAYAHQWIEAGQSGGKVILIP